MGRCASLSRPRFSDRLVGALCSIGPGGASMRGSSEQRSRAVRIHPQAQDIGTDRHRTREREREKYAGIKTVGSMVDPDRPRPQRERERECSVEREVVFGESLVRDQKQPQISSSSHSASAGDPSWSVAGTRVCRIARIVPVKFHGTRGNSKVTHYGDVVTTPNPGAGNTAPGN